jgi:hypothetical protein
MFSQRAKGTYYGDQYAPSESNLYFSDSKCELDSHFQLQDHLAAVVRRSDINSTRAMIPPNRFQGEIFSSVDPESLTSETVLHSAVPSSAVTWEIPTNKYMDTPEEFVNGVEKSSDVEDVPLPDISLAVEKIIDRSQDLLECIKSDPSPPLVLPNSPAPEFTGIYASKADGIMLKSSPISNLQVPKQPLTETGVLLNHQRCIPGGLEGPTESTARGVGPTDPGELKLKSRMKFKRIRNLFQVIRKP